MKVVLADVEAAVARRDRDASCAPTGLDVIGVVTDVTRLRVGRGAARRHARARYGAVHVLCNNAGIGAGAEGRMWEHELNDWRWALGVNVWGVDPRHQGVRAGDARRAARRATS